MKKRSSNSDPVRLENATPILRVQNLDASLDYYTRALGFKVDWREPGIIASVSRGRCGLFLCQGDQGHAGGWVWIGVSDVEPLYEEFRAAGARVRHPPANYRWALEMQIQDPDGNVLRFGSDPKESAPAGEWLDMRGERWVQSGDGKWTKKVAG